VFTGASVQDLSWDRCFHFASSHPDVQRVARVSESHKKLASVAEKEKERCIDTYANISWPRNLAAFYICYIHRYSFTVSKMVRNSKEL
jgi:hypothetical protein